MTDSADLVVLGAGPAGLTAAWRAAKRGLDVVVLERADAVGGMAGSFTVGEVSVDYGSHRLSPEVPSQILADLRSLLGNDLQTRHRHGRIIVAGRWISFPLRAGELARALPAAKAARAAIDMFAAPIRRYQDDSYAELMRAGLGPTMYDLIHRPYARKIWGIEGEEIDGDQARRRAGAATTWQLLSQVIRGANAGVDSGLYLYPRLGFGQLTDALADAAVDAGAKILLGTEARSLEVASDGVDVSISSGAPIEALHAFSTIPLTLLARITRPGAPHQTIEASGNLRFRSIVLAYVVHRGGRWSPYDVHYFPDADTPIARISEPANHRISPDDPPDQTVLCVEIPCDVGDAVWNASEDGLAAMVEDLVARTGLPRCDIGWIQVKRLRSAYPVFERGYQQHLRVLSDWESGLRTVTSFGRLGIFGQDNTHHMLQMAYDAVDALGRGNFDHAAWTRARHRHAQHVIGE